MVPVELDRQQIEATDWRGYVEAEARLFAQVDADLARRSTQRPPTSALPEFNRYVPESRVHPGRFTQNWNRSFVLEPEGPPAGAVVLLHGLTDSPYSMRHIAALYRARGYVALGIRLPAHGTVPGALSEIAWPDWMAATRLAMREASTRAGPGRPVHLVGYSNGGALAVKYALDTLEAPADQRLRLPDRIVLLSPMIGVTEFARFAGIAGWPARLPAFAKAAWLDLIPEFNPYKYNSFPVNGARQTYALTRAVQTQVLRMAEAGGLARMPPVLTFQSTVDATVSTPAVIDGLYRHLPANGSELVLFDVNRAQALQPLMLAAATLAPTRLLPAAPRNYDVRFITNAAADSHDAIERLSRAGDSLETDSRLDLSYPALIYSLSHVALPFPITDPLYGLEPDRGEDFGLRLGTLVVRGERGVLAVGLPLLLRLQSNPFFPYLADRVNQAIP